MPSLPGVCRAVGCYWPPGLVVIVMAIATAGCGGKNAQNGGELPGNGTAASGSSASIIDPDTALTVDGGRVSVASPTGWTRAERSRDYLVKYQPSRKKTYPAIVVTAEEAPAGFSAVTAENHADFAAALAAGMADAAGQKSSAPLAKQPVAVTLGQHLGAAWALPEQAKEGGKPETIERQFYAVIVGGRMYTVAAKAPKGKLDAASRAAARAVAGAIAPPPPAEPLEKPAAEAAGTATPDAKADAEPQPDDEKPAAE